MTAGNTYTNPKRKSQQGKQLSERAGLGEQCLGGPGGWSRSGGGARSWPGLGVSAVDQFAAPNLHF